MGVIRESRFRDFDKVPTVAPDIPVIHRLVTKNFASATRNRGAWCSGDRDGSPSLPGRPATAKWARQATEGPISAGRQWEELSGSTRGQPGRGAGRDNPPVARRGSRISSWDLVSEAGRNRDYPKKGRGTSGGFGSERLTVSGSDILKIPGRIDRTTSEPSGDVVE